MVLFRDTEGVAHALLDRCCHRGVRLSLGKINDGKIACGYHGWEYDGSGKCVHIPSLVAGREIPEAFGVPTFPICERDSYVWIWIGDRQPGEAPRIEDFKGREWMQGSLEYKCDAMRLIENNVDWCHPVFTHEGTHPAWFAVKAMGFREYAYELRLTDSGFVMFAPATETAETPPPPSNLVTFELPGTVSIRVATPQMSYSVIMHFVPTGPGTSRMEYLSSIKSGSGVAWIEQEPKIFTQDRIVESAQLWYERDGDSFERSVEADASMLLARQIVQLAERGEWEQKHGTLRPRRVVQVRS
jgi:phenylpropionate dioxygenase-like ring-hydroxylating dioxygenase large terminal subunit